MVALTFPDGARREYPPHSTGLDVAKSISPSLAKRTVAMVLDGQLADLSDPIERDATECRGQHSRNVCVRSGPGNRFDRGRQ